MGRGGPDAYTKSRTWVDSLTGNRNVGKKTAFILFISGQRSAPHLSMAHRGTVRGGGGGGKEDNLGNFCE